MIVGQFVSSPGAPFKAYNICSSMVGLLSVKLSYLVWQDEDTKAALHLPEKTVIYHVGLYQVPCAQ